MMISPQRATWILALACLVLAFCLVQRSFSMPVQPVTVSAVLSESGAQDASASSDRPCALSAKSLSASTPVFDAALPLLMLVMALLAALAVPQRLSFFWRHQSHRPPLRRRHLTLCVFRE
ncbi:hypothetical protein [Pantoea sp. M_9]|uniref:hypothetical protein n=1 Tax=Pantoea sp. M_9 TaxID=2608041 RepID=UPI001231BD80|nr:hypothetical protein [Pantoea sp. M_9]KAA5972474.1 hypothetical protein F3I15_00230 [Pantoea sp. M_9]